jgi:hypothetical protein
MNYDMILSKTVDYVKIHYGILFGNEKIVFIKVGAGGNIRGYQDKYLKMAHRVHDRIGATVVCASNPYINESEHIKSDKSLIKKVITDRGLDNYELYFVGTSDGGEHSLMLSQEFPETVKFLGLNSSWSETDVFIERIKSLPRVKKRFAYGAMDDDFDDIVPRLKALECDNLEIVALEGADHYFTGRVDDFIELIDYI